MTKPEGAAGAGESPKRERLEVETPEERQERLGRLFTSTTPYNSSSPTSVANPFPTTRPEIGPLPPSDLLARVRNFLPLLASSNQTLLERAKANPDEVDIENVKGEGRVIEMDLGLGVFDVQGQAGGDMGPEMEIPPPRPLDEDEEDEDDEEEDGEDDGEDQAMGEADLGSSDESSDTSNSSDNTDGEEPPRSTTANPTSAR